MEKLLKKWQSHKSNSDDHSNSNINQSMNIEKIADGFIIQAA